MPDVTVNNNRSGWIARTWSSDFDDDEPDDYPKAYDPNGYVWQWDVNADGWINDDPMDDYTYEWAAALGEAGALREMDPEAVS